MNRSELKKEIGAWKTLRSEYLIRRPWMTARQDKVELPDGRINDHYYVLEYPDWVNTIAITKDGLYIVEQQWRHAEGCVSTEICAGVIEPGETPLEAARRELQEETGFGGGTWTELLTCSPNSSTMNNHCHSFLAEGVEQISGQHLDRNEDISVMFLERQELFRLLQEGQIHQAMMQAPLWKYFYSLKNN